MIFIGTDIVPVSRISTMIQDKGDHFLNHVFSSSEQDICNDRTFPYIHYSGKFAAKEAVKKAILSSKSVVSISIRLIEILTDEDGMPIAKILKNGVDIPNIKVSISHAGDYAIATAIMEIK